MASKGIEFFDGAMSVGEGASYTTSESAKVTSGGPIEVPEGIDDGHSMSVPTRPGNAVDGMGAGSGSPIVGPMDE